MKKIKIFFLVFIILSITFIIFYQKLPAPIDELTLNDVESIAVYNVVGDGLIDYLTDDEAECFIDIINSAKYSKIGSDKYKNYVGGNEKMFCIEMRDTTKINIASTPHYLAIDEKGYKCDDATLSFIKQLYDKYEAEHYPIAVK